MLKQGLQQKLQQGLSPLQIQTIKLLELPTLELEQRIKKELEENPVLDEAAPSEDPEDGEPKNVSLSDYNQDDSTPSYRLYVNNQGKDLKPQYNTFSVKESFHQNLEMQLGYSDLRGDDRRIASFIIGSIDDDGYLRRDIESLTDDIAFRLNIETTPEHVEEILKVIQEFEPVGVGARNLRECLLLQLRAKEQTPSRKRAEEILQDYFEEFTRKHYDRIMSRTGMDKDELTTFIRLSKAKGLDMHETEQLLDSIGHGTKERLMNTLSHYLLEKESDRDRLSHALPELTDSEIDICRLIVQGKKLGEMSRLLGKSPSNITCQRSNIRAKLKLSKEESLSEAISARLARKSTKKA